MTLERHFMQGMHASSQRNVASYVKFNLSSLAHLYSFLCIEPWSNNIIFLQYFTFLSPSIFFLTEAWLIIRGYLVFLKVREFNMYKVQRNLSYKDPFWLLTLTQNCTSTISGYLNATHIENFCSFFKVRNTQLKDAILRHTEVKLE